MSAQINQIPKNLVIIWVIIQTVAQECVKFILLNFIGVIVFGVL